MRSEEINEIAAALAKAQGAMKNATLNRENPHFRSKYADLASIFDTIRLALSANGIAVTQQINGNVLQTSLLHASGQYLSSEMPLPATPRPQELGSALTYYRRYQLSALVGIGADDDDDATEAQAQVKTQERVRRAPPKPGPDVVENPPADAGAKGRPAPAVTSEEMEKADKDLTAAAELGTETLRAAWVKLPAPVRAALEQALMRRHKPRAAEIDAKEPQKEEAPAP
jgi:hypothetical protein